MDDDYNDFSSIDSSIIDKLREELNPNDIQDFSSFPRDSFVDHTPNRYHNMNNYSSSPFNQNINNKNNSDSSDEYESGYSNVFNQNMHLYQHVPQFQNYKNNKDTSYSSKIISKNQFNDNNQNINRMNNMNNMNYYKQNQSYNKPNITYQKNYVNKVTPPSNLPIPQR